jgi:spore coat protein CotH
VKKLAFNLMNQLSTALLVMLLFSACGQETECVQNSGPPAALACEPDVPAGLDPATGVSFDSDHMLCVQVRMDECDFNQMASQTRFGDESDKGGVDLTDCDMAFPSGFTWFRANISVDGVEVKRVGIRKKGFIGSVGGEGMIKPAIKIKTDKYVGGRFLGDTERLTLNNALQDGARLSTCLAYEVFGAADYPAPRCNLASVMVNGQPLGAYVHVEAVKRRFLQRAFGDSSGSLYEATITDFVEEWLPRWEIKTDDTDLDRLPLLAVAQALEAPDVELVAALEPLLNVDRFITFWAVEVLISHIDGYAGMRNNFYVYFDPTDSHRAVLLPWGADNVFSDAVKNQELTGLQKFTIGELSRRFSRIPEMNARFLAELERLLDEVWDQTAILASIDRYAAQVSTAEENDKFDDKLTPLRAWVQGRDRQLRDLLAEGLLENAAETDSCISLGGGEGCEDGETIEKDGVTYICQGGKWVEQ